MPKGKKEEPNKYVTDENKKIFDEYKRTGVKPTHLFCYKCSQKKLLSDMVKNSKKEIGVISICSECNREKTRQYKEQNREAINQKARDKHATPEYKEQSWKEYLEKLPEPLRKNKILKKHCEETGSTPTHKHCNKCGELLTLNSFSLSREKDSIFGRFSICRICQKKKRDNLPDDANVEMDIETEHNIKVRDENDVLKQMYEELVIEPTHKVCNTCEQMLGIDEFNINPRTLFGRNGRCKKCQKKNSSEYHYKNHEENKRKSRERYSKVKDTPEYKKKAKEHYEKDKNVRYVREKIRLEENPELQIVKRIRTSVRRFLKGTKSKRTEEYGVNYIDIKNHIGNEPKNTDTPKLQYDIDHIIPCNVFDFTNEEHIKLCYHPTNLRWLEHDTNMRKSNKIIPALIRHYNLEWICDKIHLNLSEHIHNDKFYEEFK